MQLRRPDRRPAFISIVPMIDVLLILLVFFMVTSTYLDLDMIPALEERDGGGSTAIAEASDVLFIRLGPDGQPYVRGQARTEGQMAQMIADRIAADPATRVLVLPSGRAPTQALVSLMDRATQAGATRLQVLRLEAQP